jgi:hypothetical protein
VDSDSRTCWRRRPTFGRIGAVGFVASAVSTAGFASLAAAAGALLSYAGERVFGAESPWARAILSISSVPIVALQAYEGSRVTNINAS